MTALPPYTGDNPTPCPKCGYTEAGTMWRGPAGFGEAHRTVREAHLARDCLRCGYCWAEAPINPPHNQPKEKTR